MTDISKELSQLRQDYQKLSLSEKEIDDNPVIFFKQWFQQALDAQEYEPNAMTLATVSADGKPSARIVLLKGVEENDFIFFTNYSSRKGQQIGSNPFAALVFFWKSLERQVRIEGVIEKVNPEVSSEYFYSRPFESQIGAISSPQSQIIESREWLQDRFENLKTIHEKDKAVVRPEHWGGYRLKPELIEFWQGRSSRLHDRIQFSKNEQGLWVKNRLAP